MKCPKCSSENINVQVKEEKPSIVLPLGVVFAGLGLMFLGIIGLILGFLIGLLIGAIVKALLPNGMVSTAVCQNCGKVWKIKNDKVSKEK